MSEATALAKGFASVFGHEPAVQTFAHGRVNLIGEHTDYNDGFVLPTAIPQSTRFAIRRRSDRQVCLFSRNQTGRDSGVIHYTLGQEIPQRHWSDYIAGITQQLSRDGQVLSGFDAYIESAVPMGGGLSSSAALAIATLRGLSSLFGLEFTPLQMARISQGVENAFVGARVGIMDPLASALGQYGTAFFIDTRLLEYQPIPLPLDRMDLLVINSGIVHSNAGEGGYNQRRRECEEACTYLGVKSLRDVEFDGDLDRDLPQLALLPPILKKRVRHVVTENRRVIKAVEALKQCDLLHLGRLLIESHRSLQHDYQVSLPEIDLLVDFALKNPEVYGARITGGGFGGSIVALTRPGQARTVSTQICTEYQTKTSYVASVLVP